MEKVEKLSMLRELSEISGIPGFEHEVCAVMKKWAPPQVTATRDNLGSLVLTKQGESEQPRIMIPAHVDEIGFMVNMITDEGFIKFIPLGGWWDQVLLAQKVKIQTKRGAVTGVIGSKPPHILKEDERNKVVKKDDMFIDVGAKSKAEAVEEFGIRPGDPIFPVSEFATLGKGNILMGKAWDDRAGCAVVLEVLHRLANVSHPNTVCGVGTVQEEVGLRGARTSGYMIQPDICLALDVGIAGDTPGVKPEESPVKLGEGPVMYLADHSVIAHHRLRSFVIDIAEKANIPLQYATLLGGGTDAGAVHLQGNGVPSLTLGIPVRYLHSHAGLMDLSDYDALVELLVAVIGQLDRSVLDQIRGW